MRAARWTTTSGGIESNLQATTTAPLPKSASNLPADSALVRVAYTTPNPVDFKVAETAPFIFSKPAIPCLDFSGSVVKSSLAHLKKGEKVFGSTEMPVFGCAAEFVVVGKEGLVPVPDGVGLREAATVGIVGLTAYQCLAPFAKAGDKVFVNGGSGGVGTYAIQIAKAMGCHVTTTCSGPNVELVKSLGADEVIDYKVSEPIQALKRQGTQYDLVLDFVFVTPDLYWSAHHFLKPDGKFVTIAGHPSISWVLGMMRVLLWPAFLGGGQRAFRFVTCKRKAEEYAAIAKWMKEGKIKVPIEKEFALEEAGKAFEHLKTGRTRGKVVIRVCGE
ncbi:NAD(P)-binding protein [Teratosphaeria nubilosa]|uniref:NAD(P)-binding protein n=1 Tax=Teratosphaeria nubilosa TaxID=161662 RepID=A0A6G1LC92_9PEZI|nr:NAD(P)-binding protein [Teratosphaeria nubilosa]